MSKVFLSYSSLDRELGNYSGGLGGMGLSVFMIRNRSLGGELGEELGRAIDV